MEVGQKPFTQKKPPQLVYLELGSGNGGMLVSISEDGFRFRAVSPVRADRPMPFAFSLDGVNRLEGSGEIESLEDDGKSGGLRFTEISDEFRSKLTLWLSSDSELHPAGREVTPAVAAPLDTMEKIRQDIRAGNSVSPRPVAPESIPAPTPVPIAKPQAEKKAAPSATAGKIPERRMPERAEPDRPSPARSGGNSAVTERSVPEQPVTKQPEANRPVADRINVDRNLKPVFSERLPEPKKTPNTASRLFSQTSPIAPETEKPAALASAFLKLARETKAPAGTPVAPAAPAVSVPPAARVKTTVPAKPVVLPVAIAPEDASATEQPRRYVPALDVSLDMAWENAKLTAPAEPPHLSRAAAGGIIAIALAVILGALGFNFRHDIGAVFVQLGHGISGDNRADAPKASQEAIPENQPGSGQNATKTSQPPASQPQSTPANSASAGKPASASPKASAVSGVPTGETTTGKTNATVGKNSEAVAPDGAANGSSAAVPAMAKAQENSAAQNPAAADTKAGTPTDAGTGQDEFDAAREILRGKDRARELSRAVELLWSAVKKGNVPAEVTLGDLYRRGDGVEKSCDQARVLLVAASKKGSADARHQLEQMAEQGCE
jgi:hypothetical protein